MSELWEIERQLRGEIEHMRKAFVAIRKLASEMSPSDPGKRNRRQGRLMKISVISEPFTTRMDRRNTMNPGPNPNDSESLVQVSEEPKDG